MKKLFRATTAALLLLMAFMATTQPTRLPLIALMVPFVLLLLVLAGFIALVVGWSGVRLNLTVLRWSVMSALLPVLLLVMRSIGQLTVRDTLIILLLFGIAYFYAARLVRSSTP